MTNLIASELSINPRQVEAVARLLSEGATVPFIARYRKEAHGNLDEVAIAKIKDRISYYNELESRKTTILKSIESQGKLTDDLKKKIIACMQKNELEDLYLPYRPKRRTRAMIAKEKGMEPLADLIWAQGREDPETEAAKFVNDVVPDAATALALARDICAERISDTARVRKIVRNAYERESMLVSVKSPLLDMDGALAKTAQADSAAGAKCVDPEKYSQYFDYKELLRDVPSHRFLAIKRGQKENILFAKLSLESAPLAEAVEEAIGLDEKSPWAGELRTAVADALKRLVAPSCEIDVMVDKKLEADRAAVEVFAENLRHLLLAPPMGEKTTIAIDPGIRTGCKMAVLDSTGKYLASTVIYPMQRTAEAQNILAAAIERFKPYAIAVGNGTAGRETEAFARALVKELKLNLPIVVSVSESGASVYSASEIAREEFPDLDLTVRGAISIGRRLQDPLAELVKIDPKSIGVGQYQHDVQQTLLSNKLDEVVESCVNKVGVELNTASVPLLTKVSGIGESLAKKIVAWRNEHGAFKSREELKSVPGLGAKAFEQCAGFLRIRGAANPLDSSAVHPERYALVEKMARDAGIPLEKLAGNADAASSINIKTYITAEVGEPTIRDIIEELKKPGRDPRDKFEPPSFRDDITTIEDVKPGMELEGVVTNVAAFGAFVDIGVHQDGLVHVSELADRFIQDPSEVVKAGDRIKVKVLSVDIARKRISLTARTKPRSESGRHGGPYGGRGQQPARQERSRGFVINPFANL